MLLLFLLLMSEIYLGQCSIASERNSCPELYDYPFRQISKRCENSGNVNTRTQQMLDKNGYAYETHTVTTEDGYHLDIFRIGMSANNTKSKGVVLIAHAIFCSSEWSVSTDDRSSAFYLVEEGYEVWLTNRRGTIYSQNDALTPAEFYTYNLDQLALNDTRSFLKYIVKITGQRVHYVGHSEGSTVVFMYASQFPEEASTLIKGIYAIIPFTYFDGVFNLILETGPALIAVHKLVGYPCLFYPTKILSKAITNFCTYLPYVCRLGINLIQGTTVQLLSRDLLNYWSRYPSKLSFEEFRHFYQIYKTGELKKYDYGTKNVKMYGQKTPPFYDLGKITLPVRLFWALRDVYQTHKSIDRVYQELGSTDKKIIQIPPPTNTKCKPYDHIDFYLSATNKDCFYPYLLASMDSIG